MSRSRLTVVLSQAPGKHPAKRALEESIAAALLMEPGLDVSIVPNLYDLGPDHTGRLYLDGVRGDLAVLTWHFPRAAYWLLDTLRRWLARLGSPPLQLDTLRLRLLKIGGRVRQLATRVRLSLASHHPGEPLGRLLARARLMPRE